MFPKSRFDGHFPNDAKTKKKYFCSGLCIPLQTDFSFFTNISIPWAMLGMEEAFIALLHFSPNLLKYLKRCLQCH